jgi:hypothetical protein
MLESLLVGLIVGVATVYAAWALAPAVTRKRFALQAAAAIEGTKATGARAWLGARLRSLASIAAGSCTRCSSNAATPAERASRQMLKLRPDEKKPSE